MRLKTYFASSVEAAMLLALEQLGPDAMIVNSRKCAADNRHLGEYEVVFATETPDAGRGQSIAEADLIRLQDGDTETGLVKRLHVEVSRLASEIDALGSSMKRAEAKQLLSNLDGESADLACSLIDSGMSDRFVLEMITGAPPIAGSIRSRVLNHLAAKLKATPSLGRAGHGRKVVALIGPAGVGKSTLIAKLATRFGVSARRSCQIISLDSDRIGSGEALRMVAGVLGVGFSVVEDSSMLVGALELARDRDLILIDTPGFTRDESEAVGRLHLALGAKQEVDVQLVLPASMKIRDLNRITAFYSVLKPEKLIFSRLDETDQIGTVIEVSIMLSTPISFLSNGPRVPEDLELANSSQLARRLFLPNAGGLTRRAAA